MKELKRLWPYIRRYRGLMAMGLVFITLSNICSTTIPTMVADTIDHLKAIADNPGESDILWLLAKILMLTAGSGVFMYATRRTIIVASRHVEEDLRNDYVLALKKQDQTFFHNRSTGSVLALFTNDISAVREFIGPAVMYTANTITTFAFALTWMFSLNVLVTVAIVIPVPLIAWSTYRIGRKIHENYKRVQEQYEQITTHAQETFSGVRVVRAYAREEHENTYFHELSTGYYSKNMRLARASALMMPSMIALFNISYILVLGVGGYYVMAGTLTVGNLAQFFMYLNLLLWPIAAIGWVTGMIQRGAASMGRLGAVLDSKPTIVDGTHVRTAQVNGDVRFENVTLDYGSGPTLKNVSFHLPAGSSLGIVGHVGSGKTSIINLIPRLFDVSAGQVTIDGINVRDYSLLDLRSSIAVVPQESFLFSDTIRENVRFGNPAASEEQVLHASEMAQLHNDIEQLPNGYDTVVGERGITLSGGQKQRTALARAILCEPSILILDDSLSAVDTDTESRILTNLATVMQNRSTIIIAHRVSAVKHCKRIIVLEAGEIVEEGSHTDLVAKGGIYADMVERQQLEESISTAIL